MQPGLIDLASMTMCGALLAASGDFGAPMEPRIEAKSRHKMTCGVSASDTKGEPCNPA